MFDVDIRNHDAPIIKPSIVINMNPKFSGRWVMVGDLTGNGKVEFVTCRNDNQAITAISAYSQEGKLLWNWGEQDSGSPIIGYDLPLQVYDINNDGKCDVFFSKKHEFIILEGATGIEKAKYSLPRGLDQADCITFANLSEKSTEDKPTDIIIKSRYREIWAYTKDWELLWKWAPKRYHKTCHHPTLVDIDGNGKDNILAGHKILRNDGSPLYKLRLHRKTTRSEGHLDCTRVVTKGRIPEETRIILTYCGKKNISLINGKGNVLWDDLNYHFESIDVGIFNPDYPSPQFYVDIDHTKIGESLGFFYDINGTRFGTLRLDYGRHHRSLDWTGDGLDEIVIGNALLIVNGKGEVISKLHFKHQSNQEEYDADKKGAFIHMGIFDINRNGVGDIVLHSGDTICIYLNPSNKINKNQRFDEFNFTYY